jgi:head-tail adaptor
MASADILRVARARIADPKNWTTGTYARDAAGKPVKAWDREATCWCAIGAVHSISSSIGAEILLIRAAHDVARKRIVEVNDAGIHADVLTVFDAAIAAAEREAGQ